MERGWCRANRLYNVPTVEESGITNVFVHFVSFPEQKHLAEHYGLAISRSCLCGGLHRAAYYNVPMHWTVGDAPIIAALEEWVAGQPLSFEMPQTAQATTTSPENRGRFIWLG